MSQQWTLRSPTAGQDSLLKESDRRDCFRFRQCRKQTLSGRLFALDLGDNRLDLSPVNRAILGHVSIDERNSLRANLLFGEDTLRGFLKTLNQRWIGLDSEFRHCPTYPGLLFGCHREPPIIGH